MKSIYCGPCPCEGRESIIYNTLVSFCPGSDPSAFTLFALTKSGTVLVTDLYCSVRLPPPPHPQTLRPNSLPSTFLFTPVRPDGTALSVGSLLAPPYRVQLAAASKRLLVAGSVRESNSPLLEEQFGIASLPISSATILGIPAVTTLSGKPVEKKGYFGRPGNAV